MCEAERRSRLPWYSRSVDSTYLTGKRVFIFLAARIFVREVVTDSFLRLLGKYVLVPVAGLYALGIWDDITLRLEETRFGHTLERGLTLLDLRDAGVEQLNLSNIAARQEVRDLLKILRLPQVDRVGDLSGTALGYRWPRPS